jgi:DCN1-like protein 1/2
VYRYAFVVGKEPDQKALGLENALTYWEMLFSPPGLDWRTASYNWLELWTKFLRENWTRSVNKDMWNQALEFATRTLADETLSFWSENAAWPSVIDDFVVWCNKRGIGRVEEEAAVMEVDY